MDKTLIYNMYILVYVYHTWSCVDLSREVHVSLSPPIADAIARESEKSPSPTSNMVCWLEYGPILRGIPNSFRLLYIY